MHQLPFTRKQSNTPAHSRTLDGCQQPLATKRARWEDARHGCLQTPDTGTDHRAPGGALATQCHHMCLSVRGGNNLHGMKQRKPMQHWMEPNGARGEAGAGGGRGGDPEIRRRERKHRETSPLKPELDPPS